jgi:diguanylate cyclase (GGDEF)-like protein
VAAAGIMESTLSFKTQLWREKLRNHPQGILVNAVTVVAFTVIARHSAVHWLTLWCTLALAVCALRYLAHRSMQRYARRSPDSPPPAAHEALLAGGLICSSTLWAWAAWAGIPLFTDNEKLSVMIIVSALAGGATGTLASMPVVGKLYVSILLAPTCVQMLLMPDEKLNILGALGLVFNAIMLNSHNNNYTVLRNTLTLTTDKEELIRQLSDKNCQISHVNQDLERKIDARTSELQFLADHDPLTSLLNRRGFIAYPYAHRSTERYKTIIFIDLDHFKDINDGLGHKHGDRLLQAVAQRLTQVVAELVATTGASDHAVCRWGGDEFAICITRPASQTGASRDDYQHMHAQLSAPYEVGDHLCDVGLSIGIFERWSNATFDLHQALIFADIATSDAKKLGRGQVSFYCEHSYEMLQRRLQLTLALGHAHEDDTLRLLYQPIVAAADGTVAAYEALLRWTHAALGPVGPDEFIPLAESTNAILSIGRWVLEQACHQARAWPIQANGAPPPKVAVNTSIRQLIQPDFAGLVAATLASSGLPAGRLVIEVTESVLDERNMATALATLNAIHDLGVEIHLDDFGTGYSSLSRLRQIPLDAIKIDKSFVKNMDEKSAAVIEAAVLIAKRYGLRVIAEGVETAQELSDLRGKGIDELQGYYFGRPAALPVAPGVALCAA